MCEGIQEKGRWGAHNAGQAIQTFTTTRSALALGTPRLLEYSPQQTLCSCTYHDAFRSSCTRHKPFENPCTCDSPFVNPCMLGVFLSNTWRPFSGGKALKRCGVSGNTQRSFTVDITLGKTVLCPYPALCLPFQWYPPPHACHCVQVVPKGLEGRQWLADGAETGPGLPVTLAQRAQLYRENSGTNVARRKNFVSFLSAKKHWLRERLKVTKAIQEEMDEGKEGVPVTPGQGTTLVLLEIDGGAAGWREHCEQMCEMLRAYHRLIKTNLDLYQVRPCPHPSIPVLMRVSTPVPSPPTPVYGLLWTCTDLCGPLRTRTGLYGLFAHFCGFCGPVRTLVDLCGPLRAFADVCGPSWTFAEAHNSFSSITMPLSTPTSLHS